MVFVLITNCRFVRTRFESQQQQKTKSVHDPRIKDKLSTRFRAKLDGIKKFPLSRITPWSLVAEGLLENKSEYRNARIITFKTLRGSLAGRVEANQGIPHLVKR